MTVTQAKQYVALRGAILLTCGLALLSGCSGGALGNLIPLPKMLSGSVRNNVYYAKNDFFSIESPFPQDSDLYTYATIKEKQKNGQASVVFHSSVAGNEYYHVEVERLPEGAGGSIDIEAAADNAIGNIQKMQANGGRKPFVLLKHRRNGVRSCFLPAALLRACFRPGFGVTSGIRGQVLRFACSRTLSEEFAVSCLTFFTYKL